MDRNEFMTVYWNYYLMLEDDFINTIRFVELTPSNYDTYSVEYAKQYQSICAEIDGLCKSICLYTKTGDFKCIKDYANIILNKYNDITSQIVIIEKNKDLKLQPFKDWTINPKHISPDWWFDHNNIKHFRKVNFEKANLSNTINSLAGLFLLNMYFIKEIAHKENRKAPDIPDEPSKLFRIDGCKNYHIIPNSVIFWDKEDS